MLTPKTGKRRAKNQVNVLKEKSTPELLKELQEKFADTPGQINAKRLQ
jgi:hypothetical protein